MSTPTPILTPVQRLTTTFCRAASAERPLPPVTLSAWSAALPGLWALSVSSTVPEKDGIALVDAIAALGRRLGPAYLEAWEGYTAGQAERLGVELAEVLGAQGLRD